MRFYINLKDEKKNLRENLKHLEFYTLHKDKALIPREKQISPDNKEWNEVLICPKISKSTDKQLWETADAYEMPIKSLMLVVKDIKNEKEIKEQLKNISVDNLIEFQKDKSLDYLPVFDLKSREISKFPLKKLIEIAGIQIDIHKYNQTTEKKKTLILKNNFTKKANLTKKYLQNKDIKNYLTNGNKKSIFQKNMFSNLYQIYQNYRYNKNK